MKNFARQLSLTSYAFIFLLLQAALILFLLYGNHRVSRSYYDQLNKNLEKDYQASISHYREFSETFFQMTVQAASTFSLFEREIGRAHV